MVRSVDIVVDLLQRHLKLDVNLTSAEVLRLNFEGNAYLKSNDADRAIECYDRALELRDPEQEGVLLVMRGTALLQRAYLCR
jgi:tetratricopeptide (TPR) repeat protein